MVRPFKPSDYETIKEWMGRRGFPVPPLDYLPSEGFMAGDLAAGFLYETKSGFMGWLEWVSSNPDKPKEERALGLDVLMRHISIRARELGLKALFTSTTLEKYGEVLERNGFAKSDINVTHYLRRL